VSGNSEPRWVDMTAMVEVYAPDLCWAVEAILSTGRRLSNRREFADALQKLIDEFRAKHPEDANHE
jgi:hypothetical protein